MRIWYSPILVVMLARLALGEDVAVDFVRDGKPVLTGEQKGDWKRKDGYLQATGTGARLVAGKGIGEGDFRIKARLTLINMRRSAASLILGDSHFGFEGAHGKVFLTGNLFGGARGRPIGDPEEFMSDSTPFTLEVVRKGRRLSFQIDGKLVHELEVTDKEIGRIALLPWRATMRVEQLSAVGNLDEKLAGAPKPPVYTVKRIPGVDKLRLLPPGKNNPRNSEGDFIRLKDGRIMFAYSHFTGGGSDHAAAHIAARYSRDDGKTWTEKDVVIVPREGKFNVMSVSLLRLQNDWIALFYLRKNSLTDCRPLMRISRDEGKTWSDPTVCIDRVGYNVLNNDRAVQLESGRIVLPVALHNNPAQNKFDRRGVISCYLSDDNGKTWRRSKTAQQGDDLTLQEPGVVVLKGGRLMMFCRTPHGSQYVAYSKDQADTWSEFQASNIVSPLSPATIERIPKTGDLLLVWNNHDQVAAKYRGRRTPYNVAISRDEGKTWERIKTLEDDPNGWYCYTAMAFVGDYVLLGHCAGDRRKGGLNTTQITRIPIPWLYRDDAAEGAD